MKHPRRAAALSAVGGAAFVPYALSKARATDLILARDWGLPGVSAAATANLFHVVELVPVALLVLGAFVLADRYDFATDRLEWVGIAVILIGFVVMTVAHFGEHVLPDLTVPPLTGDADWYLWGYYLGWLTFHGGVTTCGLVLVWSRRVGGLVPWLFVAALPLAVGGGGLLVLTDVYTFAGTNRLVAAGTWAVGGGWLWYTWPTAESDSEAVRAGNASDGDADGTTAGHSR